jgi:hypothetical protein
VRPRAIGSRLASTTAFSTLTRITQTRVHHQAPTPRSGVQITDRPCKPGGRGATALVNWRGVS